MSDDNLDITSRCHNSTSPFTRVGSQVQSLPRPPLNPVISKGFSGFPLFGRDPQHAERHANKRLISRNYVQIPNTERGQ